MKIDTDERTELRTAGVPDSRISEWKAGTGKPTISQLKVLAYVMKADFYALADDMAKAGANKPMRAYFEQKEAQEGPQMKLGDDF